MNQEIRTDLHKIKRYTLIPKYEDIEKDNHLILIGPEEEIDLLFSAFREALDVFDNPPNKIYGIIKKDQFFLTYIGVIGLEYAIFSSSVNIPDYVYISKKYLKKAQDFLLEKLRVLNLHKAREHGLPPMFIFTEYSQDCIPVSKKFYIFKKEYKIISNLDFVPDEERFKLYRLPLKIKVTDGNLSLVPYSGSEGSMFSDLSSE